jgi:septum formation protein
VTAVRVVLASGSPRRRDLLNMIGVSHEAMVPGIDEAYLPGEEPRAHAERLAREKGSVVLQRVPGALVISADTIVVLDNDIMGKPLDPPDAARMLRKLSGRRHRVLTAVAVGWQQRVLSGVDEAAVTFRNLTDDEIAAYIATGEPEDKAGAYGIQGYGATIVERIDGDFFTVMGLALGLLVRLVRDIGLSYRFDAIQDG